MIKKIISWLRKLFGIRESNNLLNAQEKRNKIYSQKKLMTDCEYDFYNKIVDLEPAYHIIPQINLASIIKKDGNGYINELFRNIDFAIFDKNMVNLLLLIELNDSSHNKYNRRNRDLKVKKICNDACIKLITFYTNYPNEKNYVIDRILKEIKSTNVVEIKKE